MRIIGRSRTAIGIDVGSRSIKAVQLCLSGPLRARPCCGSALRRDESVRQAGVGLDRGRHQIASMAVLPRLKPGGQIDQEETAKLRQVLKRQGFRGNDIVLAVPDDKLLRGVFELPRQVSGDALNQIARMEMSRTHNIAADSFEMACWSAEGGFEGGPSRAPSHAGLVSAECRAGAGQAGPVLSRVEGSRDFAAKPTAQTMVVGCLHEAANTILDVFEQSGFNVVALDTASSATIRACAPLILTPPAITSILDLGWSSTKLLLVCGRIIVYERQLGEVCISKLLSRLTAISGITEQGAWQVVSAVGFTADAEPTELDQQTLAAIRKILAGHFGMLPEELKAPFAYANHQYPGEGIKRLLLIGGGAAISGIAQHLQQTLAMETMPAPPCNIVRNSGQTVAGGGNPAATVALGLAQFAARPSSPKSGA